MGVGVGIGDKVVVRGWGGGGWDSCMDKVGGASQPFGRRTPCPRTWELSKHPIRQSIIFCDRVSPSTFVSSAHGGCGLGCGLGCGFGCGVLGLAMGIGWGLGRGVLALGLGLE